MKFSANGSGKERPNLKGHYGSRPNFGALADMLPSGRGLADNRIPVNITDRMRRLAFNFNSFEFGGKIVDLGGRDARTDALENGLESSETQPRTPSSNAIIHKPSLGRMCDEETTCMAH